jgi:hypothetical protein
MLRSPPPSPVVVALGLSPPQAAIPIVNAMMLAAANSLRSMLISIPLVGGSDDLGRSMYNWALLFRIALHLGRESPVAHPEGHRYFTGLAKEPRAQRVSREALPS